MATTPDSDQSLEAQLEMLRALGPGDSAQRVESGITQRVRAQRRQVIIALLGTCVAVIGTIHFVLQGDAFSYFALAATAIVMALAAWRSAHRAAYLATPHSGRSMVASWRDELSRQRHHAIAAVLIAVPFTGLAAWVVWRHGMPGFKSTIYLAAAAVIWVFAGYQCLVVRPALQRELDLLDSDE